ncbi:hypothetical protein ACI2OX_06745 [Bacillus sp. N9]
MIKSLLRSNLHLASMNFKEKSILFSETMNIDFIEPTLFYSGNQHLYKEESFFWKSPDENFSLVGLGAAYVLKANGEEERFFELENQWRELCDQAEIINPFEVSGTGPLLFGGFSFDPNSRKEEEWEPFGQTLFICQSIC